jgi:hypothetical protein
LYQFQDHITGYFAVMAMAVRAGFISVIFINISGFVDVSDFIIKAIMQYFFEFRYDKEEVNIIKMIKRAESEI